MILRRNFFLCLGNSGLGSPDVPRPQLVSRPHLFASPKKLLHIVLRKYDHTRGVKPGFEAVIVPIYPHSAIQVCPETCVHSSENGNTPEVGGQEAESAHESGGAG